MTAAQQPAQDLVEQFVLAARGNPARLRELLAQEPALLNAPWEKFDETALQAASHTGRRDIAEHLLAAGAPLDICAAAMLGRTDNVREYLRRDPSQARATGAHGIPLLFHAALSGETEIADLLVAHGGGEGVDAALHGAVRPGHLAMTRWLLERGANPNAPNFEGKTPLRMAVEQGHDEIAALLRERGGTE
jgi:ankyrin repeat protein